jgi:hypothetical protein
MIRMKSKKAFIEELLDTVLDHAISDGCFPLKIGGDNYPDPPRIYLNPKERKKLIEKYVRLMK